MLLWGCLPSSVLTMAEHLIIGHDLHHAKVNVTGKEWLPIPMDNS